MIVVPKFVSLDTSTLGRLSNDYWSGDAHRRSASLRFLDQMVAMDAHIVISFTHLIELFRHNEDQIVQERIRFLRQLPLVAWPRPYDRAWFVGSTVGIGQREMHSFVHRGKRGFKEIRDDVREDLWETGVGYDMFPDRDEFWVPLIQRMRQSLDQDRYIASFAITADENVSKMTLGEFRRTMPASPTKLEAPVRRLARNLTLQVATRGDKKLNDVPGLAKQFAEETRDRVQYFLAGGADFVSQVCRHCGVPESLVSDETTVSDLGELATLSRQMEVLGSQLTPPALVTLKSVPPESLPTLTLDRKLIAVQQSAHRVAGSDLNDGHLAALALYADATEVDKRTHEYLNQVVRQFRELHSVLRPTIKSSNYVTLLNRIRAALE